MRMSVQNWGSPADGFVSGSRRGKHGHAWGSFSHAVAVCSGLDPTQRELADFLSLDPSQVVTLVDDLERRGLVERMQGEQDRRQNHHFHGCGAQDAYAGPRRLGRS